METIKSIEASLHSKKSTYIRVTGGPNNPIIYESDYKFEIGKSITLKKGNDVTLFGSGAILENCMIAAKALEEKAADALTGENSEQITRFVPPAKK